MKKLLSFFLCAIIGTSAALADNLTYDLDSESGVLTISGTGPMERTFYKNTTIKSVVFNEGVTSIPNNAFDECTNLTSISIAESVTSIGNYAFRQCKITEIVIPKNVASLGKDAFAQCHQFRTLVWDVISYPNDKLTNNPFHYAYFDTLRLGDNVVSVPENICDEFHSPSYISFGSSVQSVNPVFCSQNQYLATIVVSSDNTKYDCRNNCNALVETSSNTLVIGSLNTIIPSDVTSIGDYAFAGRNFGIISESATLSLPSSVISIGNYAFRRCFQLHNIVMSANVTSIGTGAFEECTSLSSMSLPNGVSIIKEHTFYGCSDMTSIEVGSNLTSIENYAFYKCGFASIDLPSTLLRIGTGAFSYCGQLTSLEVPNSVTDLGAAFSGCPLLREVKLPDGITSIAPSTFLLCNSLDSIAIPAHVASIGTNAFKNCDKLRAVRFFNETPAELGTLVFTGGDVPLTLYVPCNTGDAYRTAWADLASLIVESECGSAGIDDVSSNDKEATSVHKTIRDGQLLIECDGRLYNAQGTQLK